MGLFGNTPNISQEEFRKVLGHFRAEGWSDSSIDMVESLFRGDMNESGDWRGIDAKELADGIKWLRENRSKHSLIPQRIDALEQALRAKL